MTKSNTKVETNVETPVVEHLAETKVLSSTSARIRYLSSKGMKNGAIVKFLNEHFMTEGRPHPFRYQHVRNVLNQKLKGE